MKNCFGWFFLVNIRFDSNFLSEKTIEFWCRMFDGKYDENRPLSSQPSSQPAYLLCLMLTMYSTGGKTDWQFDIVAKLLLFTHTICCSSLISSLFGTLCPKCKQWKIVHERNSIFRSLKRRLTFWITTKCAQLHYDSWESHAIQRFCDAVAIFQYLLIAVHVFFCEKHLVFVCCLPIYLQNLLRMAQ